MTTNNEIPNGCKLWPDEGEIDNQFATDFLTRAASGGCTCYLGPSGSFGASKNEQSVLFINRGRGKRWELSFQNANKEVESEISDDGSYLSQKAEKWLNKDD